MKPDRQPDIVETILQECQARGGISADVAHDIEQRVRFQFGGDEVYVSKRLTFLTPEFINDQMQSGKSANDIAKNYGITRRTIYRIFRRGRKEEVLNFYNQKDKA